MIRDVSSCLTEIENSSRGRPSELDIRQPTRMDALFAVALPTCIGGDVKSQKVKIYYLRQSQWTHEQTYLQSEKRFALKITGQSFPTLAYSFSHYLVRHHSQREVLEEFTLYLIYLVYPNPQHCTIHMGLVVSCLPDVCNNKASDRMVGCPVTVAKKLDLLVYPMSMCVWTLWGFRGFCQFTALKSVIRQCSIRELKHLITMCNQC